MGACHGAESASLNIAYPGVNSPAAVNLTGTGVQPVTVAPATLGFGNQPVGTQSAPKTVTVTNNQSTPVTLSISTSSTDFIESPGATPCGSSLAAGATCTINVQFAPVTTRSETATLNIAYSGVNSPAVVNLSGTVPVI